MAGISGEAAPAGQVGVAFAAPTGGGGADG
jgi:hypothetical protein